MGIFGNLFGGKPRLSGQSTVQAQLPEVEAAIGRFVVDFHDRTKLQLILIFPVMHKVAAKLFVEDFGPQVALNHYERMMASMSGTIRESQFRSFDWPEMSPHDAVLAKELDKQLWHLARELVGKGVLKETIANALTSRAMKGASQMDALVSIGFIVVVLRELRAGVYNPPPEKRPEVNKDTDEVTTIIFNQLRDSCYAVKEYHTGLLWQHLLPGLQRVCVKYCIKYQGHDGALKSFRTQIQQLAPLLEQCPKNPPQQLPLSPEQVSAMAVFNEQIEKLADFSCTEFPEVHPAHITYALSMLITQLASTHYDLIYLSAMLTSSCREIEQGHYASVTKTH